jgi:hypothetical protein
MKLLTTIVAAALLSAAALPAIAQQTTNAQGEAVGQSAIPAAPTTITPKTGSLSAVSTVKVLAVADASGLVLDGGPNSALTGNPKVTDALTKGGYSGSQIIGYAMDGSDLTVYVKAG